MKMQDKKIYEPKDIEKKWQDKWEEDKLYKSEIDHSKAKMHILDMFPYPSGEGLHAGHAKIFGASDIYARMKRMQGFNVLKVQGYDAFGLPAEQYAIKNKVNPKISTKKNTENFEKQMRRLGLSYDWSRSVNTTDPKFYKWTQWIFKQLYKDGLCYESHEPINWCPSCKTGLANEDLENGVCERCGSVVEKRPIRQWVIKITDYAEKLLSGVNNLDWKESIKEMQRNWIGKSEGAEIDFKLSTGQKFTVFTTRPDTLFGCTYCVFAPENNLVKKLIEGKLISNTGEVENYIKEVKDKPEIERTAVGKEKTGVKLEGVMAINPANQKEVPVYIADYVLNNYGTGAIMAVPAHDERDFEFAKRFDLEIKHVLIPLQDENFDKSRLPVFFLKVIIEDKNGKYLVVDYGNSENSFINIDSLEGEDIFNSVYRNLENNLKVSKVEIQKIERLGYIQNVFVGDHTETTPLYYDFGLKIKLNKNLDDIQENTFSDFGHFEIKPKLLFLEPSKINLNTDQDRVFMDRISKKIFFIESEGVTAAMWSEDGTKFYKELSFLKSEEAKKKITEFVGGKIVTKYKLRDWVFARQRYWGEPFPIVFDENHKSYLVADSELPVVLPDVESYEPTGDGESPLKNIKEWVEVFGYINEDGEFVSCEKNNTIGKTFFRETNTMPQWAGSSWYWMRYMDPHNDNEMVNKEIEKYWGDVDIYLGGLEHATRHLIYGRFWNQFLYDKKIISTAEPFKRLEAVGLVLGEGGVKMSKRLGNVINPDDIADRFGVDTLRLYIAFAGDYHDSFVWDTKAIVGPRRFIERIWAMQYKIGEGANAELTILLHQTIKKVTEDYEKLQFHTAIAQMMIFVNTLDKFETIALEDYKTLLKLLAPVCPFVTEEIWSTLSFGEGRGEAFNSIHLEVWPKYDGAQIENKIANIAIQINGKLRDTFSIATDSSDEKVLEMAKNRENYKKWVGAVTPKKIIVIKNKIVNVVL